MLYAKPKRRHVHREPGYGTPSLMRCNGLDLLDPFTARQQVAAIAERRRVMALARARARGRRIADAMVAEETHYARLAAKVA